MTATKAAKDKDMSWVPVLPGWVSLPVAGEILKVSRQLMFQMAQGHQLESLHQVAGAGDRPAAYVISEDELAKLQAKKVPAEPEAAPEAAAAPAAA
jgi:hypothetical protein